MSAFGKYLRKGTDFYTHWCPGCDEAHMIFVGTGPGPRWTFNDDPDKPTFGPSIRVFKHGYTRTDGTVVPEQTLCHYFIQNGVINFCGDCQHKLNGQQGVPLPEWAAHIDYGWPDQNEEE
jgi:hypothetical protein